METSGLIHIYTGEGKGKTTAALGLAMRACGCGSRVMIVQFLKGRDCGELCCLENLGIQVLRNKRDYGFFERAGDEEKAAMLEEHNANLNRAVSAAKSGECDLLLLDEAVAAYNLGALDRSVLDGLIKNKPERLELVLTGRQPPPHFVEAAHYVTEMKKIKHPYDEGLSARKGIEY